MISRDFARRLSSRARMYGLVALLALPVLIYLGRPVWAEGIPTDDALVYSGALTDAAGAPLSSPQEIALALYAAASGGSALCQSPSSSITLDELGRFQITLPDSCAAAVASEPNVWVEVSVDDAVIGRSKIGAVPYAIEAGRALETASVPTGAVMLFDLDACPPGWTALESARGRTLVGVPSGGTRGGTVGTAFTDLQNPTHTHAVDPAGVSTSDAGGHTHMVDPPSVSSSSTGSHTHSVNPSSFNVDGGSHNHVWSAWDGPNGIWTTYLSSGGETTMVDWDNGMDSVGEGQYPLQAPTNVDVQYFTQPSSVSLDVDVPATTTTSDGSHTHSIDVASTTSTTAGMHSHTCDVASTTSSAASATMPYVQLLVCRKD